MRFLLSSIVLGTIGLVAGIRKELLGVEEQKGGPISTCCVVDGYNHLMLDQDFMEEARDVMLTLEKFYNAYQFKKTSRWNPFAQASCPSGMAPAQDKHRCGKDMKRLMKLVRLWKEKVSKDKRIAEIKGYFRSSPYQGEVELLKRDIAQIKERTWSESCRKQVDILPLRPLIIDGSISFQ
eukprot:g3608.t1